MGYNIRPILEKSYDVHTIGLTDDDDIKFIDADGVTHGARVQFKEILGVGLSYNF